VVSTETPDSVSALRTEMLHMAEWASSPSAKRPMVFTKYAARSRSHVALLCGGMAWLV
jgi:hypothetical protein